MAEPLAFAATCGVTFINCDSLTKSSGVITFIGGQGECGKAGPLSAQSWQGHVAFGMAVRMSEARFDHEAVAFPIRAWPI